MALVKIAATIYLEIGGRDPEDVAVSMDRGLASAIRNFPDADEVIKADVNSISAVSDEEAEAEGLTE